jgi:hypothetical protein
MPDNYVAPKVILCLLYNNTIPAFSMQKWAKSKK